MIVSFAAWLETSGLGVWVRESPSMFAFPFILVVHAWGMGFLAGGNAAVDLRILGFAPKVPLPAMEKFYPFMWFGFIINAVSGVLLLAGYPTKALTNPVFYLKLACIAVGTLLMVWLRRRVVHPEAPIPGTAKIVAVLSLLMWIVAIVAGRLLAYTCRFLMVDTPC